MQKRWYDLDPTLSLAVSLMEKADEKVQLECAYHIIDKAKDYGVKISDSDLSEAFNYLFRRWYDRNKQLHDAFEYLKASPYDVQLGLAFDIIEKLEDKDKKQS